MRTVLLTALAPAVWGTTYVVTTEVLPPGRPLLAAALRALPAGLLLLAVTRQRPSPVWWWRSAVLGTLNIGLFFALLFVSAYRLPGGVAAVAGALQPLVVVGLSAALLGERARLRSVLTALAGAGGVALVVLSATARLDALGVVAAVAGTCSMALGLVLTKRWGRGAPVVTATAWQLTAGGLLLLPVAVTVEGVPAGITPGQLAGYAYLSVLGTAVAYVLWFSGLQRLPTSSASLLALLSPVVAAVVGWVLLGERLGRWQLLGMAVVVGAVVAGQQRSGAGRPRSAQRVGVDPTPDSRWATRTAGTAA